MAVAEKPAETLQHHSRPSPETTGTTNDVDPETRRLPVDGNNEPPPAYSLVANSQESVTLPSAPETEIPLQSVSEEPQSVSGEPQPASIKVESLDSPQSTPSKRFISMEPSYESSSTPNSSYQGPPIDHQNCNPPAVIGTTPPRCISSKVETPKNGWRSPPPHINFMPFVPLTVQGRGVFLKDGFPPMPPPSEVQPHPFVTHDVTEEDWLRLLTDIGKGGGLTSGEKVATVVLPIAGICISADIKSGKRKAVGNLVDEWNHHFFHPRRMEVVLVQGERTYSGIFHGNTIWDQVTPYPAEASAHSNSIGKASGGGFCNGKKEKREERAEKKMVKRVGKGKGTPEDREKLTWRIYVVSI